MTLKCHAKVEKELTHGFKNDMRNLVNFHQGTEKSEIFTFMGYFCPKYIYIYIYMYICIYIYIMFELKKY